MRPNHSQTTLALRPQRGGHVVYLIHFEHASTRRLLVFFVCSATRACSTSWGGHVPHTPFLISGLPEVQLAKKQYLGSETPRWAASTWPESTLRNKQRAPGVGATFNQGLTKLVAERKVSAFFWIRVSTYGNMDSRVLVTQLRELGRYITSTPRQAILKG